MEGRIGLNLGEMASIMVDAFQDNSDTTSDEEEKIISQPQCRKHRPSRTVRLRLPRYPENKELSTANYLALGGLLFETELGELCPNIVVAIQGIRFVTKGKSKMSWEYPVLTNTNVLCRTRGRSEYKAVVLAVLKFFVPKLKWEMLLWNSKKGVHTVRPSMVALDTTNYAVSDGNWCIAEFEGRAFLDKLRTDLCGKM